MTDDEQTMSDDGQQNMDNDDGRMTVDDDGQTTVNSRQQRSPRDFGGPLFVFRLRLNLYYSIVRSQIFWNVTFGFILIYFCYRITAVHNNTNKMEENIRYRACRTYSQRCYNTGLSFSHLELLLPLAAHKHALGSLQRSILRGSCMLPALRRQGHPCRVGRMTALRAAQRYGLGGGSRKGRGREVAAVGIEQTVLLAGELKKVGVDLGYQVRPSLPPSISLSQRKEATCGTQRAPLSLLFL